MHHKPFQHHSERLDGFTTGHPVVRPPCVVKLGHILLTVDREVSQSQMRR